MADSTPLYNPNDGLTGRNGGPYLDEEQARTDEVRRARIEGREPDLDNPAANAGIQLSTAAQMLASLNVANNPSMQAAQADALDKAYRTSFGDRDDLLTSPVADEVPDVSGQPTLKDLDEVTFNEADPNAPSSEVEGEDGEPDVSLVGPSGSDK